MSDAGARGGEIPGAHQVMPYRSDLPRPVTGVKVTAGANGVFEYELLFGVITAFTA